MRHEKYGKVVLTSEGARLAQNVYQRHRTLHQFLVEILKVDSTVAEEDACRMEHSLSATSLNRLAKFLEFVLNCPRGEPEWLKGFSYYLEHGNRCSGSATTIPRRYSIRWLATLSLPT